MKIPKHFRRLKAEAEIMSQWWKVKWEDITIQKKSSFFSSCSGVSYISVRRLFFPFGVCIAIKVALIDHKHNPRHIGSAV